MRNALLSTFAALLLFAGTAAGQSVTIPPTATGEKGSLIPVTIAYDGDVLEWELIGDGVDAFREYDPDPKAVKLRLLARTEGKAHIVAFTSKGGKSAKARCCITIGTPTPGPGPTPGPTPVPPTPPAPIPVDGFRVLFVTESSEITPATAAIINAKAVRDYLNSHCALSADGKSREWANFDKDADLKLYPKLWQDAMARPRKSLPWLVISNGKTGFEGPLPATIGDTLKLLKTIGGE